MSWNDELSHMEGERMESWLECMASPGQFSGEYSVALETIDARIVSLFAPKDSVEIIEQPDHNEPVAALLRVEIANQQDDVVLVRLPRPTLENGQHITVRADAVRQEA